MKVLFITNVPSPYRVDFFNELGKLCELTVCYERESAGDRDTRWRGDDAKYYTAHFTKARHYGSDKTIGLELIQEIKTVSFERLIITGYASPAVMLLISYCRFHNIPFILESDGGFCHKDSFFKKIVKKWLLKKSKYHFTTCEQYSLYLKSLGISSEIIKKYPFSSIHDYDIAESIASQEEKDSFKKELGIIEEKVVLSVGQFIPRKGFDILLNAASTISSDIGFYLVGGVPPEEYKIQKDKLNLNNIHFIDFKSKNELIKWYRSADLFVLPTREDIWGLVINEAMSQGLPIITTERCIAGLELVDDDNGSIIPIDNSAILADEINRIICNDNLLVSMSNSSLVKIKHYTIENMAKSHIELLEAIK